MQQALIVLLYAPFALIAGWSLVRAARTGRISSRGWTFQRDESPLGFWLVAIFDLRGFDLRGLTFHGARDNIEPIHYGE